MPRQTQNRRTIKVDYRDYSRDKAFAYILAGAFLLIEGYKLSNNNIKLVGLAFGILAILLLIAPLILLARRANPSWVETINTLDKTFSLGLYIVTLGMFIIDYTEGLELTGENYFLWAAFGVLLLVIIRDIIFGIVAIKRGIQRIGVRPTMIRLMLTISLVLSMAAAASLIFKKDLLLPPIGCAIGTIIALVVIVFLLQRKRRPRRSST